MSYLAAGPTVVAPAGAFLFPEDADEYDDGGWDDFGGLGSCASCGLSAAEAAKVIIRPPSTSPWKPVIVGGAAAVGGVLLVMLIRKLW
jgi:hypothetical protein